MADVLPSHSHMSMDVTRDKSTAAPLPNPHFVFPMPVASSGETKLDEVAPPGTDSRETRRSAPRSRPLGLSLNALPAFDFGPASSSAAIAPPSPPRSPMRRTPPAYPSAGHKRNGSEFVGGDVTNGGPMLVSTSPTKNDLPSGHQRAGSDFVGRDTGDSGPIRLGPPTSRRGHAHRRSGAVSSHDLSMILKPPAHEKPGSAPTTPSDPVFQRAAPPELDRSSSQPVLNTNIIDDRSTPSVDQEGLSTNGLQRPRARFADSVEYIPRPLSTISSETSSSMSTIRANHSVANSISSIVSTQTSNVSIGANHTLRRDQISLDQSRQQSMSRPRTAEPFSRLASGDWDRDLDNSEGTSKRPSSAPSGDPPSRATVVAKSESAPKASAPIPEICGKFFLQPPQPFSVASRDSNAHLPRRRPISPSVRPRTSPEPKVTKRQRKGRSWAGLLSRKTRQQDLTAGLQRRTPTPPSCQISPEAELSLDDINFDQDGTYIIETTNNYTVKTPSLHSTQVAWEAREPAPCPDTDNPDSVLDIDEALGAYDTPGLGPSFEDVIGIPGSTTGKRPMHSSGATGSFAGPGMHYHRRAESAPEMDAIDRSRFGFPRLGSNPAMAIEEEEEEADEEDGGKAIFDMYGTSSEHFRDDVQEDHDPGLGVNVVEADSVTERPIQRAQQRSDADLSDHRISVHARSPRLHRRPDYDPVDIVNADEEPRFSVITKSSDESTITPTLSQNPLDTPVGSATGEFAMSTPALTYGTSETPSVISSPEYNRTSFDHPRMHTARSSITDRATLDSSRAADHGLGLHSSVDDVPSLTSSASTMSAHPTRFSSSANSAADRSSSFSAAVPARTRPVSAHKRLSLASLSRLTGGSYNKSRLNIEESASTDPVERIEKKKGNRISRMMKFWKSKEKLSTS